MKKIVDKKYYILYNKNVKNESSTQRLFEWDYEKERRNIRLHKISFETAKLVFNDPNRIELFDLNHSGMEDRIINKTRIISARIATKAERRLYGTDFIGFNR